MEQRSLNEIAELIIKHVASNRDKGIHVEARPVEVQRLFAEISQANKLLGFRPKIDFERGIALLVIGIIITSQSMDLLKLLLYENKYSTC